MRPSTPPSHDTIQAALEARRAALLSRRWSRVANGLAFVALLLAVSVLIGSLMACEPQDDSQGHCKPGATRAAHGHTDVCNKKGKWAPYVKPTVLPLPKPQPNWQTLHG